MYRHAPSASCRALPLALAALIAACGGGGGGAPAEPPPGAPAAPTGFAAAVAGPASVALSWDPPAAALGGYELQRAAAASGPFALLASPGAGATAHEDAGLGAGQTYYYRLRALGSGGSSAWTAVVSATLPAAGAAPVAPGGLAVSAVSASSLLVDWIDQSDDETRFDVERAPAASGPFALVTSTGTDVQSFLDTGLAASTTYWYRVRAANGAGPSGYTAVVAATTLPPPPPPPGAPAVPTGVTARATGPDSVAVSWLAAADATLGLELERATTAAGPFALVAAIPAGATGRGDAGLVSGTTYHYRLRALGPGGASGWSTVVSATPTAAPPPPAPPPAAPLEFLAGALSDSAIELTWRPESGDETGFELERATALRGPFVALVTLERGATSHVDGGLPAGTRFWYRLRALSDAGPSDYTKVADATTFTAPPPAAPANLTVVQEIVSSAATLRLAWSDLASTETGYEVQRLTPDGVTWGAAITLGANATGWVDTSPLFASNTYRVRAVGPGGASAWVQGAGYNGPFLVGLLCPVTEGVTATATGDTSIQVGWTWNTCSSVAIDRAPATSGPWTELARRSNFIFPAPATGSLVDTGLSPGQTYYYRVRTLPLNSQWMGSAPSQIASATTTAAISAPGAPAVTILAATRVSLTWTDPNANETAYAVEIATAAAGPFEEVYRTAANVTSAGLEGFTPGTAYWVRIRAVGAGGLAATGAATAFTTQTVGLFRATGDASVMESTADSGNQAVNLSTFTNDVGCLFVAVPLLGPGGAVTVPLHNCFGSALRFDTAALAGRTILSARLRMYACGLAPGWDAAALHLVRALAGPWNPATVTFNTLPNVYVDGGATLGAPTTSAAREWDVTAIVRNWASGAWGQNGLYVEQYPVIDRVPTSPSGQDQTINYCSLDYTGGSPDFVPTLLVEYR